MRRSCWAAVWMLSPGRACTRRFAIAWWPALFHCDTAWRELAGFRSVIVHGYLGVDLRAVWLLVGRPESCGLQKELDLDGIEGKFNLPTRRSSETCRCPRCDLRIRTWSAPELSVLIDR